MRIDIERHDAIKRRLRSCGVNFRDIAFELGYQPSFITLVSQGRRQSARVEAAIAARLSTTPDKLWPDRYETEGPAMT